MKKLFTVLLVCLTAGLFAEGQRESMRISVVGVGATGGVYEAIYEDIEAEYPFVKIDAAESDMSTGEDITMLARLAAGDPPDVYTDFVGRAGKYVNPAFALPLDIDESVWDAEQLGLYRRGGKLYALPMAQPGQAMAINTTFLDSIGYELPEGVERGWSIAEFLDMCEAVKQSGVEGVYGTGLFAANPSADYLWINWFASFGAESFFADDYTRSTADSGEFLATWKFFDLLRRNGYIHPNSAMWGAAPDFLQAIGKGTMVAYGARMGWPDGMQKNFNPDGEHYEWIAVPFPSVDGSPVMTAAGGHIVVAHKTDDPVRREILTKLTVRMASDIQYEAVKSGGIPTRTDISYDGELPKGEDVVNWLAREVGILDVGFPNSWYYETRSAGPEVLQPLLKGEITPEEAHRLYFETITDIIE